MQTEVVIISSATDKQGAQETRRETYIGSYRRPLSGKFISEEISKKLDCGGLVNNAVSGQRESTCAFPFI